MNSTVAPSFPLWHVSPRPDRCLANVPGIQRARHTTYPAYIDGRKHKNSSFVKDRLIVASTCRRSEQFGRVPTVMEKHGKAWKKSCHGKSWKMGEKNKIMEIQKCHGKVMEFLHCLSQITHEKFR